jgi:ribosomal RNA assembly protein
MKYIRVPKERIAIVIGHQGKTKNKIEQQCHIKLEIDSEEGEIAFDDSETDDPLLVLTAEDIIRAIGRGFSPEHAFRLKAEDMELSIIDIRDYVGKKSSHIRRLKSRVIGTQGKTKKTLEHLTGALLSVYGHTISIIADFESMDINKRAIDMLLSGSKHASVYRYVEREMKKMRLGFPVQ